MSHLGFEPKTHRLKADYSTIELVTLFLQLTYFLIIPTISEIVNTSQKVF